MFNTYIFIYKSALKSQDREQGLFAARCCRDVKAGREFLHRISCIRILVPFPHQHMLGAL